MELISSSENEESDEHMAEKDHSESSDDKPMRINVLCGLSPHIVCLSLWEEKGIHTTC